MSESAGSPHYRTLGPSITYEMESESAQGEHYADLVRGMCAWESASYAPAGSDPSRGVHEAGCDLPLPHDSSVPCLPEDRRA